MKNRRDHARVGLEVNDEERNSPIEVPAGSRHCSDPRTTGFDSGKSDATGDGVGPSPPRRGGTVTAIRPALLRWGWLVGMLIVAAAFHARSVDRQLKSNGAANIPNSEQSEPSTEESAKALTITAIPITSSVSPAATAPWDEKSAVFPISFGLPEGRFGRAKDWKNLHRKRDFAHIVPGKKRTYKYTTESAYYDGYAEAFFGITMKKAGWDCLRHYEIIASGSMPYFLDHATLPENVLFDFPMSIVREAMELPGVPTQTQVKRHMFFGTTRFLKIDHSIFNETEYDRLMDALVVYSLDHSTWRSKAQYMFNTIRTLYPCMEHPKILMVTTAGEDYQSSVIFGGLYSLFGVESMSSYFGPKKQLFQKISDPLKKMYGNGFSYSNVFSDEWNMTEMDHLTQQRLDDGFFNTIVFTNAGNRGCTIGQHFEHRQSEKGILLDYQQKHNPLVVTVDGSDVPGCHGFFRDEPRFKYHAQFVREYQTATTTSLTKWSGCEV